MSAFGSSNVEMNNNNIDELPELNAVDWNKDGSTVEWIINRPFWKNVTDRNSRYNWNIQHITDQDQILYVTTKNGVMKATIVVSGNERDADQIIDELIKRYNISNDSSEMIQFELAYKDWIKLRDTPINAEAPPMLADVTVKPEKKTLYKKFKTGLGSMFTKKAQPIASVPSIIIGEERRGGKKKRKTQKKKSKATRRKHNKRNKKN